MRQVPRRPIHQAHFDGVRVMTPAACDKSPRWKYRLPGVPLAGWLEASQGGSQQNPVPADRPTSAGGVRQVPRRPVHQTGFDSVRVMPPAACGESPRWKHRLPGMPLAGWLEAGQGGSQQNPVPTDRSTSAGGVHQVPRRPVHQAHFDSVHIVPPATYFTCWNADDMRTMSLASRVQAGQLYASTGGRAHPLWRTSTDV